MFGPARSCEVVAQLRACQSPDQAAWSRQAPCTTTAEAHT
jgi:hypothetical protein